MKRYVLIFIISFIVFSSILGGGYLYLNNIGAKLQDNGFLDAIGGNDELIPPNADDEIVTNTLLLGVDEARSDTMIVVRYNRETHQMAMISIPRDTRVDIPSYGFAKINSAIGKKEGTALAMKTVSNLLNIPIHHYVKVDFKGVENIVDIIGGVEMNVPNNMNYEDPAQDLYIHIAKGEQLLDGKKALQFLRFRAGYANQDLGRIEAQQEFAKAFIKKLTSPVVIPKAFSLINAMTENVKTNLRQDEIKRYIMDIGKINVDQIKMYTVPGEPEKKGGVAYFIHDEQKLSEIMDEMSMEIGAKDDEEADSTTANLNSDAADKSDIKIEILNSTGTKGLASALKKELEQKGFTVDRIGDIDDMNYSYSRVIDRHGDKKKLETVAKETGIDIIDSDINTSYDYDITIIIGNDKK